MTWFIELIFFQMQQTGLTLTKVTCQLARKCRVRTMGYAFHMRKMCMITAVTVQQDMKEGIVRYIRLVNLRTVMEGSVYREILILWSLFVFVLWEE